MGVKVKYGLLYLPFLSLSLHSAINAWKSCLRTSQVQLFLGYEQKWTRTQNTDTNLNQYGLTSYVWQYFKMGNEYGFVTLLQIKLPLKVKKNNNNKNKSCNKCWFTYRMSWTIRQLVTQNVMSILNHIYFPCIYMPVITDKMQNTKE